MNSKHICKKCGFTRGQHQVYSYNCPEGESFSLKENFSPDFDQLELTVAQKNSIHSVLEQIENILDLQNLNNQEIPRKEVLDVFYSIRQHYSI